MTLDARSKERLEALGRTLPKPLPLPNPPQAGTKSTQPSGGTGGGPEAARHHLEQEQDPANLFRALMQASPDGSVPPHLLDRLRELERAPLTTGETIEAAPPSPAKGVRGASSPVPRKPARGGRPGEEADLYAAFAQLLLEDEGSDP